MMKALVDSQLLSLLSPSPSSSNSPILSSPPNNLLDYIQPASVDLPLYQPCYLVKDKILPFQRNIRQVLQEIILDEVNISNNNNNNSTSILLKGQTYLCYCGYVNMPSHLHGSLSPKSSIGRIDVMVRGIFDLSGLYDCIPPNSKGELWLEITPRSFNIRIKAGLSLSQMMVFTTSTSTSDDVVTSPSSNNNILTYTRSGDPITSPQTHRGSLVLSLGLIPDEQQNGIVGWEAIPTNEILDLTKIGSHIPELFFKPLYLATSTSNTNKRLRPSTSSPYDDSTKITLEKDKFYILCTKERISIPTCSSAEMIPFSHHIGELRAHYAGFFDPGFGYGKNGSIKGTVGVLEVRPHETITIYDGQPICLIEFFNNVSEPEIVYGDAKNNYQFQTGPKLAKYFR
jgi:dCTP deaminase